MLLPFCAMAQQRVWKLVPAEYELEHLRLNNKEDIGIFNDITEDKEGYLWLSGTKGLHAFDGNHTITYTNGNNQYELAQNSVNKALYFFTTDKNGNFWVQEENDRLLFFEPGKRKCTHIFEIKAGANDKIYYTGMSNEENYFIASVNQPESRMDIWRISGADSLVKVYETKIDLKILYQYTLAGNNHWVFQPGLITRVSLDGTEVKQYDIPTSSLSFFYRLVVGNTLYFIDDRQEAIYTWNSATDKIEVCIPLPPLIKGKINSFYVKDNIFYLANNLYLFILDRSNNTMQDLSAGFAELARKEAPNSLGINFMKFFLRSDNSLLVCTQADIYRLKKKVPAAGVFRQTVNVVNNISQVLSFRALAEDDKKIFTRLTTLVFQKRRPAKKILLLCRFNKVFPATWFPPTALITGRAICSGTM